MPKLLRAGCPAKDWITERKPHLSASPASINGSSPFGWVEAAGGQAVQGVVVS